MIERESKYLVIAPVRFIFQLMNNEEEVFDIEQTYLDNIMEEERVREVYDRKNHKTKYYHTIKKEMKIVGVREEIEKEITEKEYEELLKRKTYAIDKHRLVVNGWEIDLYDTIHLLIAEYEHEEGENIPDFPFPECDLVEVTENTRFKNKYLAIRFGY